MGKIVIQVKAWREYLYAFSFGAISCMINGTVENVNFAFSIASAVERGEIFYGEGGSCKDMEIDETMKLVLNVEAEEEQEWTGKI